MKEIRKCPKCGTYTLKTICPLCGAKTEIAKPQKFSPDDKYAFYRRKAIEPERIKKGLLIK